MSAVSARRVFYLLPLCVLILKGPVFADEYSASGRVTTPEGLGVSNVTITLQPEAGYKPVRTAATDSGGSWNLNDLACCYYDITPSKAGFAFNPTFFNGKTLSIYTVFDFTARALFNLSGKVVDNNGQGAVGVEISFQTSGAPQIAPVFPDTAGNWSQSGFQTGIQTVVQASKAGFILTPESLGPFTSASTNVNFVATARALFNLSGKVVDNNGQGAVGVKIYFQTPGAPLIAPVFPNTAGNWSQGGFQTGIQNKVQVEKAGFTLTPGSLGPFTSASTNVNFVLSSFRVSGTVTRRQFLIPGVAALPAGNVKLTFTRLMGTGAVPTPVYSASTGKWSQSGFSVNSTYTVTPSLEIGNATPSSRDFIGPDSPLDFLLPAIK